MRKKIISVFICVVIGFFSDFPCFSADSPLNIGAEAAILIGGESNEIIYSKNPHKQLSMASTTKVMTAIVAIEQGNFDEEITVTDEMVRVEGTSSGLLDGDKTDLNTLLYCMMLQSGNDAANAVAFYVGDSQKDFADLMNEKAEKIGMTDTHFSTASGLDADDHYSTAYDMAILTSYALKNPLFKEICSTYKKTVTYGNPRYRRTITNHNKLLNSYEGMIGVKTGFTKKSGRCLITAAERNGLTLVCVTLNDWNDWEDHRKLLDYGFDIVKPIEASLSKKIKIDVVGGILKTVDAELAFKPNFYSVSDNFQYHYNIEYEHFLYAPVLKNDIIGNAVFYDKNSKKLAEVPLVAVYDVDILPTTEDNGEERKNRIGLKRIVNFLKGEK